MNKKLLLPLAAAVAALSDSATAKLSPQDAERSRQADATGAATEPGSVLFEAPSSATEANEALIPGGENLFKFIIRRSESGEIFADHQSHYSHSSHASHHSHYSSRW